MIYEEKCSYVLEIGGGLGLGGSPLSPEFSPAIFAGCYADCAETCQKALIKAVWRGFF